jgi:hypothetical protein
VGARPELGGVRLAEHHGAGLADAGDERLVCIGDVLGVDGRAVGRADARRVDEILVRDRQPVQRSGLGAGHERIVQRSGSLTRGVGRLGHDRVDRRVP